MASGEEIQTERRSRGWKFTLHLIWNNPLMVVGLAIVCALFLMAFFAPLISPHDPFKINPPQRLKPPSATYLLGTDVAGRDIFSRIVYGSRITLQIGITVIALALLIGYFFGMMAGFFGGAVDELFMRITDIFMSFPYLVLAMGLTVALGPSIQNAMLAMAVVWWPTYARLVRSEVLKLRGRAFIYASRELGATNFFDEPTSALDVSVQAQILNLLKELQREFNLTYLFISHDLSVINHMCVRVAVMYLGELVELSPCKELFSEERHPYTQVLLSSILDPSVRQEDILLEEEVPSASAPPPGCRFHQRCRFRKELCSNEKPPFVEVRKGHFVACFL